MHNQIKFYLIVVFLFFINQICAQVPKDFEFLDHRAKVSTHLDSKVIGDKLLYAVRKNSFDMTAVGMIDMQTNELDTILTTFWGETELREFSDGSSDFFVHSLFDYDVRVPLLFHISIEGNSIKVDTLHSYILPDPTIDQDFYPRGAAQNIQGDYFFIDSHYLYYADDLELTIVRPISFQTRLFQNDNRDVYLFEDNLIVKVNDISSDTLPSFPSNIIDIKNRGTANDVLLDGMIQTWNDDFSQILRTWEFTEKIESFYEVHVTDTLLTIINGEGDMYEYRSINEQGVENIIASGENENENVQGFHLISDNIVVSINDYLVDDIISSQLLFRSDYFDETQNFQSRDLSIDSVNLIFDYIDTFDLVFITPWDTFFETFTYYKLDIGVTNYSDSIIESFSVFTTDYHNDGFGDQGNVYEIFDNIPSGASTLYNLRLRHHYTETLPDVFYVGITGTDFRKNNDPFSIQNADITLDIDDLVIDDNMKIYPNPANDIINIEVDSEIEKIAIYNVQGQLMLYKEKKSNFNKLDVSKLESGSYFIKLWFKNKKEFSIQQFIKF